MMSFASKRTELPKSNHHHNGIIPKNMQQQESMA